MCAAELDKGLSRPPRCGGALMEDVLVETNLAWRDKRCGAELPLVPPRPGVSDPRPPTHEVETQAHSCPWGWRPESWAFMLRQRTTNSAAPQRATSSGHSARSSLRSLLRCLFRGSAAGARIRSVELS